MNLLTILGAACVDPAFRELLFSDPEQAVRCLGIVLTNLEMDQLKNTLKHGGQGLQDEFHELQMKICPMRPCPYALATNLCAPGMSSAAD